MPVIEFLLEPLQYSFMVKAVIVSTTVGVTLAIMSCFLILKNWALLGDAISHAVLPGVVLAYIVGVPFGVGAFIAAMLAVTLIGYIKNNSKVKEDAVMGIVFTMFFALGVMLISKTVTSVDLTHVLFGEVLGISNVSAWYTSLILLAVSAIILLYRRIFTLFCFDAVHGKAIGLPMHFIHYVFLGLLAIAITGSIQTVGIILVIAMLITPGATAFLLTKKLNTMIKIAVLSSVFSSLIGAYSSYYFDVATGATIVFVQSIIFLLVLLYTKLLTNQQQG